MTAGAIDGGELGLWTSWVSMDTRTAHKSGETVWSMAAQQHGVVSRRQLIALGWHPEAIKHRVRKGRLHRIRRGVYAVGRPNLSQRGHWMAAVLACGPDALLSHRAAAALWGIRRKHASVGCAHFINVTVEAHRRPRSEGIRLHRVRGLVVEDRAQRYGIPVISPIRTLIDLALVLTRSELEGAINEADRLGLVTPEKLRSAADSRTGQQGVGPLRTILDRRTFSLTDSDLERRSSTWLGRRGYRDR